jgi:class 3 adenylate cyclase
MPATKTRYARYGDLHVAYQEVGTGPPDIVFVAPYITNVEAMWEFPLWARYLDGLAGIGRLILFDAIGSGLSDPLPSLNQTLDSWTNDVRVVMDAVELDRATIHCFDSAGVMAMLFAATYPQRTSALILVNTFARALADHDYPGLPAESRDQFIDWWAPQWGTGELSHLVAPSLDLSPLEIDRWARPERQIASPGTVRHQLKMILDSDVRDALPLIQAPTLVIHRKGNQVIPVGSGRYLAQQIPGAKYVELPGADHVPFAGDYDTVLAEIREFLTGVREAPVSDRVLATLLFTDVVGSTRKATELGDRRWRELLDDHDLAIRQVVEQFRGRVVKTTGDGALAIFDGPARAIEAARAISQRAARLGLQIRAGLHTGECETRGSDVGGIAVHLAARVAETARPGEILVSRTVKDLVAGSGIEFSDRGSHQFKGISDEWRLFSVSG